MNRHQKLLAVAVLGAVATGTAFGMGPPTWTGSEKCGGVSAKGMNDCGSSAHGCAGKATADRDANDWIWVPQGTCTKIAGGTVK